MAWVSQFAGSRGHSSTLPRGCQVCGGPLRVYLKRETPYETIDLTYIKCQKCGHTFSVSGNVDKSFYDDTNGNQGDWTEKELRVRVPNYYRLLALLDLGGYEVIDWSAKNLWLYFGGLKELGLVETLPPPRPWLDRPHNYQLSEIGRLVLDYYLKHPDDHLEKWYAEKPLNLKFR